MAATSPSATTQGLPSRDAKRSLGAEIRTVAYMMALAGFPAEDVVGVIKSFRAGWTACNQPQPPSAHDPVKVMSPPTRTKSSRRGRPSYERRLATRRKRREEAEVARKAAEEAEIARKAAEEAEVARKAAEVHEQAVRGMRKIVEEFAAKLDPMRAQRVRSSVSSWEATLSAGGFTTHDEAAASLLNMFKSIGVEMPNAAAQPAPTVAADSRKHRRCKRK